MCDNREDFGAEYYCIFEPHPTAPGTLFTLRRTSDHLTLRRQMSKPCLADFQTAEAELAGLAVPFAAVTHFGMDPERQRRASKAGARTRQISLRVKAAA
jgi:hypothetical protein